MKLPKKYFRKFPGQLKKAWAAYKRDLAARKRGKKTTTKKSTKTGAKKTMATKKKTVKKAAKKVATKIKYRTKELNPMELMIRSLIAIAAGAATGFAINRGPVLRNFNPIVKSLTQGAAGFGMLYFIPKKYKRLRYAGFGPIMAGGIGLTQKLTPIEVLAGEANLSDQEIKALMDAGYLNGPEVMSSLNGPVELGANPAFMGENPAFMGDSGFKV